MTPFLRVSELAAWLRAGAVSAREVAEATLGRIERLDPVLRAYVTVAAEGALAEADRLDARRRRGEPVGPLHGVPVAVKDTLETAGIRTTYGSRLYRTHVPAEDQLCVERLRAAGAIVVGKTSTPEFSIGPLTWNELTGLCLNPHDPARTCGGSSGGSAVAVAAGLCAAALGSDLGGSLRVPASFCGVVAFRTSPGRVPQHPKAAGWDTLNVNGPMARTVGDAALLTAVMAGPDPRDPVSIAEPGAALLEAGGSQRAPLRVAWSADLGTVPVQSAVRSVCARAVARMARAGWTVEEAHPDVAGASEIWTRLRPFLILHSHHARVAAHRSAIGPAVVERVEQYARLGALEVGLAEQARTRLYHEMRRFLAAYDLLVTPAASVEPWEAGQPLPLGADGRPVENPHDWEMLTWIFTLAGLPALSVPCGRSDSGMPVGLQLIGRYRDERTVLAAARALEGELGLDMRPPAPWGV
jgi:amidase